MAEKRNKNKPPTVPATSAPSPQQPPQQSKSQSPAYTLKLTEQIAAPGFRVGEIVGHMILISCGNLHRVYDMSTTPITKLGEITCKYYLLTLEYVYEEHDTYLIVHKVAAGLPTICTLRGERLAHEDSKMFLQNLVNYVIINKDKRHLYLVIMGIGSASADPPATPPVAPLTLSPLASPLASLQASPASLSTVIASISLMDPMASLVPIRYVQIRMPKSFNQMLLRRCGIQGFVLQRAVNMVLWRPGHQDVILRPYTPDHLIIPSQNGHYQILCPNSITYFNEFTGNAQTEYIQWPPNMIHHLALGRLILYDNRFMLGDYDMLAALNQQLLLHHNPHFCTIDATEQVLILGDDILKVFKIVPC